MSDTRVISRRPTHLLLQEHELLGSLIEAYQDLAPSQVLERSGLFRRIEEEIGHHVGTEEALFYPALLELKDPELHSRVREALADHRALETLVGDLHRVQSEGTFDLLMKAFLGCAVRHLEFEERKIFPFAAKLPRVAQTQLGLDIEERQMHEEGGPRAEGDDPD